MRQDSFFRGKKVLITGHTGFKGSWLCQMLILAGAEVTGYALEPLEKNSLFNACCLSKEMHSEIGDIRDTNHLLNIFRNTLPEIVFHLAAQPLVIESYQNPVYTYETNVIGTVNVLECVRKTDTVRSVVNVTTDKVYLNREWEWGYRENEELNGFDPYSNSKSCSELVTSCYINSFLNKQNIAVSTMRAGNVIGGGDMAENRIIPDCIRAAREKKAIEVRNPYSIRPYQHVLEALSAYLLVAKKQYQNIDYAGSYNIGPSIQDCLTTGSLVERFCRCWKKLISQDISWTTAKENGLHEANYLRLDCSKLKHTFGWEPKWNIDTALQKVVEWEYELMCKTSYSDCMRKQIEEFIKDGD